jgi:ribonuclease HI
MVFQLLLVKISAGVALGTVHVFSDSQHAIGQVLRSYDSSRSSPLARTTRRLFLEVSELVEIYLHWVPGHAQVLGNDQADALATDAAHRAKLNGTSANLDDRVNKRRFLSREPGYINRHCSLLFFAFR